jgi:hypothetical protein
VSDALGEGEDVEVGRGVAVVLDDAVGVGVGDGVVLGEEGGSDEGCHPRQTGPPHAAGRTHR